MPKYGKRSTERLNTCDKRLQDLFNEVIKVIDVSILEGHRGQELQDLYFSQGKSKLSYPKGKHNSRPSKAVDSAPYPIDWKDMKRFIYMAGIIKGIAHMQGTKIRQGIDWNGDNLFNESWIDAPHTELVD